MLQRPENMADLVPQQLFIQLCRTVLDPCCTNLQQDLSRGLQITSWQDETEIASKIQSAKGVAIPTVTPPWPNDCVIK
jgi:hypothetical protein